MSITFKLPVVLFHQSRSSACNAFLSLVRSPVNRSQFYRLHLQLVSNLILKKAILIRIVNTVNAVNGSIQGSLNSDGPGWQAPHSYRSGLVTRWLNNKRLVLWVVLTCDLQATTLQLEAVSAPVESLENIT